MQRDGRVQRAMCACTPCGVLPYSTNMPALVNVASHLTWDWRWVRPPRSYCSSGTAKLVCSGDCLGPGAPTEWPVTSYLGVPHTMLPMRCRCSTACPLRLARRRRRRSVGGAACNRAGALGCLLARYASWRTRAGLNAAC